MSSTSRPSSQRSQRRPTLTTNSYPGRPRSPACCRSNSKAVQGSRRPCRQAAPGKSQLPGLVAVHSCSGMTRGSVVNATSPTKEMAEESITFREFLESIPPASPRKVTGLTSPGSTTGAKIVFTPSLRLHCPTVLCNGVRTFSSNDCLHADAKFRDIFLVYLCQNCKQYQKIFSLRLDVEAKMATKYGEIPNFGPPIPARAISLIGGDRELFLKGRRCELQGLGIAAFTYYRRVIEDQRNRIFDEIIRVLEGTDPTNAVIPEIKAAKNQQQFSASVDTIKHAWPASLLIHGHNPLRMLHSALSEGVHAMSDEDCLELATAIRTVLFEFSERLAQTLNDDAELAEAVKRLNRPKKQS